jgi:SAM-dependent methyltransferase
LSLARLGATVTGVDFSDRAITEANILADRAGVKAVFVCCNLYELPKYLNKQFDIVFTTYGTIGWLPDLDKWAQIVSGFLKPNGKFVFAEFHPVVWMFDYDFQKIGYDYFNTGPIVESEIGTYADKDAPIEHETISWNHGIGEVLNSLTKSGMEINSLDEFDYSPYDCLKGSIEFEPGKFRIANLEKKIPMVYSILATKKTNV